MSLAWPAKRRGTAVSHHNTAINFRCFAVVSSPLRFRIAALPWLEHLARRSTKSASCSDVLAGCATPPTRVYTSSRSADKLVLTWAMYWEDSDTAGKFCLHIAEG